MVKDTTGGWDLRVRPAVPAESGNLGPWFLGRKNSLEQRTHKLGASKNMGAVFLQKTPAATYPQVRGFQKYGALFC